MNSQDFVRKTVVQSMKQFAPALSVKPAIANEDGNIIWPELSPERIKSAVRDVWKQVIEEIGSVTPVAKSEKAKQKNILMASFSSEPRLWGLVAYVDNILFGSGRRKGATYTETSYEADDSLWYRNMKVVTSDYLFAMDKVRRR